MKQYVVQTGENLYDISLKLYGSIEGIVDLLASNDPISMDVELEKGTVLNYHDEISINSDIVKWLDENAVSVKNGNPKLLDYCDDDELRIVIKQSGQMSTIRFALYDGTYMLVDWGDGSSDRIDTTDETELEHNFEDFGNHIIRIYGNANFRLLDFTDLNGTYYLLNVVHVGDLRTKSGLEDLDVLFTT